LLANRYRIFALIRNPSRREKLRALGVVPLAGDLDDRASLARIAGLADAVLHFAPPANSGACDTRTRNLLGALSHGTPPGHLVYISTSDIYGDCAGDLVNESRTPNPQTARARRRLNAERQIRHWARRNRVNACILRVPGIYASDRLPLERLRTSAPCIVGSEDSYTNHIHADDLARISIAALQYGNACRVYHASDDSNLKMGGYFDAVADAFGLPRPPRLPREQVEQAVSPMMWSFMNESRRLDNRRMKQELGVNLRYPTVADTLAAIARP